ncbi:MAG: DPP IV N-terminal domain-containing protein [Candidatus Palauibacterales bacterium]|nr:DPP IV N-terminal domain-containing protein [Candidatus Palauibacterales bacterium]MDP2483226.1 DPP IV N-terminal domain-containing protein [Candidatus Palauibacterales bacterium]
MRSLTRGAFRGARILLFISLLLAPASPAQEVDPATVTLDRLYGSSDFRGDFFGQARWLDGGTFYTTIEPSDAVAGGRDLVRYETEAGVRTILVSASLLMPEGRERAMPIQGYEWSPDGKKLLVFTNSRRVWRQNTRGDYWVLDLETYDLRQIGADRPESSLMFAKFDPASERVAYVSEHDIYVEDIATGDEARLTSDGSDTLINGTFDWVYEEEFFDRDGFRWSPDGASIAYWQLDAEGVRHFLMINNTDSVYSYTIPVEYPKAGTTNSAARVGVIPSGGGSTTWCDVPGDQRNNYIPRMEWSGNSDAIVIQRMNRHQNTNQVMLCDGSTGATTTILTETDPAYLDAVDDWNWLNGDREFTWISERTGWRHLYRVSRDGKKVKAITDDGDDWEIIGVERIDEDGGRVYFTASPDNATQRYLYRARLNGRGDAERLTPEDQPGTHGYNISPDGRYALHTYSRFGTPSMTELIRLPDHEVIRTLVDNRTLKETVAALDRGKVEFFQVDIGEARLDAWMMYPPDFDPAKQYPILFYGYSEPWGQTVQDAWGGGNYLWHLMLTQQGYIVASVDNRGTPGPRGRDWRKALYRKIGQLNVADLSSAARIIISRPFVDPERVGTWGWSGGGEMALNLIFQYPDVYGTAIAVAAVSHQKYYDTIYTEKYMGLPDEAAEDYEAGAPITHARDLEGNLLLVHGTGDDNVHYQNFEALVNELIRHNKHFTMLAYPNRSHGIFEGEGTRLHLYTEMTRYLNENMPPGGTPESSRMD